MAKRSIFITEKLSDRSFLKVVDGFVFLLFINSQNFDPGRSARFKWA